jgi:hypothetical protein
MYISILRMYVKKKVCNIDGDDAVRRLQVREETQYICKRVHRSEVLQRDMTSP